MKNDLTGEKLELALFKQTQIINQLQETWKHLPHFSIGKLLSSAMEVQRGEKGRSQITRTERGLNPLHGSAEEIIQGLRALIPFDWETEEAAA